MATQVKKTNQKVSENIENEEMVEKTIEETKQETEPVGEDKDAIIQEMAKKLKEKDDKYSTLEKSFEEMQKQLTKFMSGAFSRNDNREDEDILVGCRAIYGGVLSTNDNRIVYKFECDEEKYISSEDLRTVFKESIRDTKKLFEQDIFYFVEEENYSKFKIKRRIDLSQENIVRILLLPTSSMIDEINTMTNRLIDFSTVHALQFEIVKMLIDPKNPLRDWKYDNRTALERYLNQRFDDLMASVGALELLGRKNFR